MSNPIYYRCSNECGWSGEDPNGIATPHKTCPVCEQGGRSSVARPFVDDQRPGWLNWLPIDTAQPLVVQLGARSTYSVPVTVEGRPSYVQIDADKGGGLAHALATWRHVAAPQPSVQVIGVGKRALQLLAELVEEEP